MLWVNKYLKKYCVYLDGPSVPDPQTYLCDQASTSRVLSPV